MDDFAGVFLLLFGLVTGIRHGIDIDHIAAITDIVTSQTSRNRGVFFAILYALGHSVMVIILGVLVMLAGQNIPQRLDIFFGRIVGITLIVLGLYVLYSLFYYGDNFKLKSRWMLIFDAITFGYHKLLHNFDLSHHHPKRREEKYGIATTFGVGIIHGIGAETPTQIAALAALIGIGGGVRGMLFLSSFVLGIFLANTTVAYLSSIGFLAARKWRIYILVGLLTAIFSIIVGINFLVG